MSPFNIFQIIYYQEYLLQLEEYNITRYLRVIKNTRGLPHGSLRKKLDPTPKLILITLLALLIQFITVGLFVVSLNSMLQIPPLAFVTLLILAIVFTSYYHYLFLIGALLLLSPVDYLAKTFIIASAKEKLIKHPDLKIIGIAGSFGKTTFKELLTSILREKYTVLSTPKNINTPIGIARLINKSLTKDTEILVVEMGEYYQGDIKMICDITPPDIAVVTGINEAHLEKMGSLDITVKTIFEVVEHAKPDALVVVNIDSALVAKHYQIYLGSRKVITYSAQDATYKIHTKFHEDASGITFTLEKDGKKIGEIHTAILGEYVVGDIIGALQIAESLGLTHTQITQGVKKVKPVAHRLEPILNKNTNVLVIDDSYNGNPDGVGEAIKVLSRFKNRRKLYLTPGLVEAGERTEEVHYNIGKTLSDVADRVILIKNSVTPYIEKGLRDNNFPEEHIIWFDTAQKAHDSLGTIIKSGDVILFQNDWPDNYF